MNKMQKVKFNNTIADLYLCVALKCTVILILRKCVGGPQTTVREYPEYERDRQKMGVRVSKSITAGRIQIRHNCN